MEVGRAPPPLVPWPWRKSAGPLPASTVHQATCFTTSTCRCSGAIDPVVQQLLACGDAVQSSLSAESHVRAALLQFSTAVNLASPALASVMLVKQLRMEPAAATAAVRCVELLLGAGCACLSRQDLTSPLGDRLASQITLMRMVFDIAVEAGVCNLLASRFAPPQALVAWLSLVVDCYLAVLSAGTDHGAPRAVLRGWAWQVACHGSAWKDVAAELSMAAATPAGVLSDLQLALPELVIVCHDLFAAPDFAAHSAAIQKNSYLTAGLAQLLAPAFQAASVELQLPAGRRLVRRGGWTLAEAGTLAAVLAVEQLHAGVSAHLTADGPGIGANALQLLQPACQLLSLALPDRRAEAAGEQLLVLDGCWLLIRAVSTVLASTHNCMGSCWFEQRAQRLSQLLLQLPDWLVPYIRRRTQATNQPPASILPCILGAMAQALKLLLWLARPPADPMVLQGRPIESLPNWQPWCAAASAMLRSLPALAELAQRSGGDLPGAVTGLVGSSFKFASGVAQSVQYWAATCSSVEWAAGTSPPLGGLCHATFQLHTDVCRAVHWSRTAQPPGVFEPALLLALSCAMAAAAQVPSALPATAAWLPAMAAAHCAAVQTVCGPPERMQQLIAAPPAVLRSSIEALAVALAALPQAAAADNELSVLLARQTVASLQVRDSVCPAGGMHPCNCGCLAAFSLFTDSVSHMRMQSGGWSHGHEIVLRMAESSHALATHLVAYGAMEAMLTNLSCEQVGFPRPAGFPGTGDCSRHTQTEHAV